MSDSGFPGGTPAPRSTRAVFAARSVAVVSLLGVVALLAWLVAYAPATTQAAPTTSAPRPRPGNPATAPSPSAAAPVQALVPGSVSNLVFQGPGVLLVAVIPGGYPNEGRVPSRLFLTTDGTHWTDVTPPQTSDNGTYPVFEHASFINSSTGWVSAWNLGTTGVTIFRTSDQGKSWTAIAAGRHSQAAGATELIDLVGPHTAFAEYLEPTGPGESLAVTTDAGGSWRTVYRGPKPTPAGQQPSGPDFGQIAFNGPANGFAAGGLPPIEPFATGPQFFHTTDGGSTWTPESPPLPEPASDCPGLLSPQSAAGCAYSLPSFEDPAHGVLAAVAAKSGLARIAFDTTGDGGASWKETASVSVTVPVAAYPPGIGGLPALPLVSMPASGTWWVLGWDGTTLISRVTTNGGSSWKNASALLPFHGTPMGFGALDGSHAVVMIATPTSTQPVISMLVTSDGGQSWHQLRLPASGALRDG